MPTKDCELITDAFLGQPVNTITTLAFLVAAVVIARRPRLRWAAWAIGATGVGSFLFHGPMPAGSQWAHDVSLAWLILVVAGIGHGLEKWTHWPGLVAIGVLLAAIPGSADVLSAVLTATAGIVHLRRRSTNIVPALFALAVVAIFGRLGSTGGPLCNPDSLFQPHGVWHVGAAAIVAWFVLSSSRSGTDGRIT